MSNCMPSVNSSSMPKVFDSSTVTTPSLPTLSRASAMISPIVVSAAEMDATWAISSLDSTSLDWSLISSTAAIDGLLDAALEGHRVGAGGDVLHAALDHGAREHRGRGGAVTGDVVRLGGDLLGELGAHVLPRVLQLDLLGDRHAVVRDRGSAPLLVEHHVLALGPERDGDGVGELVDARPRGRGALPRRTSAASMPLVPPSVMERDPPPCERAPRPECGSVTWRRRPARRGPTGSGTPRPRP